MGETLVQTPEVSKYLKQPMTLVQSIYVTVTALSGKCLLFYTALEKKRIHLNYVLCSRNAHEMEK